MQLHATHKAVSDTPTPPKQKEKKINKQRKNGVVATCLKVLASHSVAVTCISSKQSKLAGPDYFLILGLQPCVKAAMLLVNWIQFFLEELTWKWKCFSSWPPTLPPWRHVKTSNTSWWLFVTDNLRRSIMNALTALTWNILSNLCSRTN